MRLSQAQRDRLRELMDSFDAGIVREVDATMRALVRRGLVRVEPTLKTGVWHAVATPEGREVVASAPAPKTKQPTGPPSKREQQRRWGRRE